MFNQSSVERGSHRALTIVCPVGNEAEVLPVSLANLNRIVVLPGNVDIRVILATNASTDGSKEIVEEFIKGMSNPVKERLVADDSGSGKYAITTARRGRLRFTHYDTDKPGKANVLNIAADIAISDKSNIVINSDIDTLPEPEAIKNLYGTASNLFGQESNKVAVVWGKFEGKFNSSWGVRWGKILGLMPNDPDNFNPPINNSKVTGCLFAWNPNLIRIPEVAMEDRALSVEARVRGFDMVSEPTAIAHGLYPNNLRDDFLKLSREARGLIQIREFGKEYADLLDIDKPEYAESIRVRTYRLFKRLQKNNHPRAYTVLRFGFTEAAILKARFDYWRNPENQSWEPIKSTKKLNQETLFA